MTSTAADKTAIEATQVERERAAQVVRFLDGHLSKPARLVAADGSWVIVPEVALRVLHVALRLIAAGRAAEILPGREVPVPRDADLQPANEEGEMDERKPAVPVEDDEIALIRAIARRGRRLTIRERILERWHARGIRQLLRDYEREHGPIPEEALERARRAWPTD